LTLLIARALILCLPIPLADNENSEIPVGQRLLELSGGRMPRSSRGKQPIESWNKVMKYSILALGFAGEL
jgi:hypothetical protein